MYSSAVQVGAGPFVPELDRILALPRRAPVDCSRVLGGKRWEYAPAAAALGEYVTAQFARLGRGKCGCEALDLGPCISLLNPVQAWVLRELPRVGGIIGMLGVGTGKTNCGILAPLAIGDCRVAVILAEPSQRLHYRNAYLRLREHFRVPSIVFDDGTSGHIVAGAPVLHFIPYSRLSQPGSTDLLERLQPDLIVCDEAHRVAARSSSRTMRFLRYLASREGKTRLCAWSGTLAKKSVKDVAHLASHALGVGSPMPIDPDNVEAWAAVLDPSPTPDRTSSTALSLRKAFTKRNTAETSFAAEFLLEGDLREGFRKRLVETSGVTSTRASSIDAAIYFHERKAPKIPQAVQEALAGVRQRWVRPDGEELVEATDQARCAREVACGYHYYWAYPNGEADELIEDWFAKRKAYHKELRARLLYPEPHLDSPLLCANAAERFWNNYSGDLPKWKSEMWPAWRDVKDQVQHDSRSKWIDSYLAADAAAWAKEHRGVVWCQSSAFGKKVAEIAGLPYHGGGPEAEAKILAEDGSRSVIASIKAHGAGRDGLQFKFSKHLVAEPPSSGDIWEQLLGRLHRHGQTADVVETWVYLHVSEFRDAIRKAVKQAEFVEAATGNEQKLLLCDMEIEL